MRRCGLVIKLTIALSLAGLWLDPSAVQEAAAGPSAARLTSVPASARPVSLIAPRLPVTATSTRPQPRPRPTVAPPATSPPPTYPPASVTDSLMTAAPALPADLPDPFVLRDGSTCWVYATGHGSENLQVLSSPDLTGWSMRADPLPVLPAWAEFGTTWAPGVARIGGQFLMYYAARAGDIGRECLSVAVSASPGGPFVDSSSHPLTCQVADAGSIDPFPFISSDGTPYLLWKSEDNGIGHASRIGAQQLSPDGLSLVGPRPLLLRAGEPWQAGVVEGPAMIEAGGRFFLFYGANHWDTVAAGIGYAVCDSPLGPCVNVSVSRPWLSSHGAAIGPSGPDPFVDANGTVKLAYHAWTGAVGYPQGSRSLWIDTISLPQA